MSERVKLCKLIVKKKKRLIGAGSEKSYGNFPFSFSYVAGDQWEIVAEKLGFTPQEIRFLDKRTLNPAEALIGSIANQRYLSVGELYDVLCDCDLPVVADLL